MARPALTVDLVIKLRGGVVLVKRKNEPYRNRWALPGGFVEYGEKVEDAAVREAWEETGLRVKLLGLVGIYSDPHRDPRGHTVSICFLAKRAGGRLKSGSDASEVGVFRKIPWGELAFDHAQILKDAGFK
ncbi:MAG: NUDIX hydrolase [Candidatus Hadarchaeum sp.]|uniref:NUDIX hydrolase n=1 Tax=Candidatus Hadarchaeum sp. TaxID=2883567 RepID=UPI00317E6F10